MALSYATKLEPAEPIRIDNRVTVGTPLVPQTVDILDGPTVNAISGVRVNDDIDFNIYGDT